MVGGRVVGMQRELRLWSAGAQHYMLRYLQGPGPSQEPGVLQHELLLMGDGQLECLQLKVRRWCAEQEYFLSKWIRWGLQLASEAR